MRFPCATKLASARHLPGAWLVLAAILIIPRVGASAPITVSVDDGAISLAAHQQPRALVLRELLAACGLSMPSDLDLSGNITLTLNRATLDQALRRLLPGRGFVLRYHRDGSGPDRLWLMGRDKFASRPAYAERPESPLRLFGVNHPDPLQRIDLVFRYAEEGNLAALEEALGDPDPRVREAAVEGLWDIGDERAYQSLLLALQDPVDAVSNEAAEALAELELADP